MNRAVVALVVIVSMLGCFPHSPRKRTIAQIGEGTAILAGIAISAFANTTADCDNMDGVTGLNQGDDCRNGAKWATTAGVALIVGGLLGFVATVSTAQEDAKPKPVEIKEVTEAKPAASTPAQAPQGTGSASESTESSNAGSAAPSAPQR
jgi:hypothetical protein